MYYDGFVNYNKDNVGKLIENSTVLKITISAGIEAYRTILASHVCQC